MSSFQVIIIIILISALYTFIFMWYHRKSIEDVMKTERSSYFEMKAKYEGEYQRELNHLEYDYKAKINELESQIRDLKLQTIEYDVDKKRFEKTISELTSGKSIEEVEGVFYKEGYIDGYKDCMNGNEAEYDIE